MSSSRRGGGVSRRCECRGPDGKLLDASCPLLVKKNHGRPQIHQELPARADGRRRRFRRTGYATVTAAQADIDRIRSILDLAGDDPDAAVRIADYLETIAKERTPLPEVAEVSRKLNVGVKLDPKMLLGDYLDKWLSGKEKLRKTTANDYASQVRVHIKPRIGHLRIDRLSVGQFADFFQAIEDANEVIAAENQARREQEARCRAAAPGRPKGDERARMAAEQAKLTEMKPYRRLTGPARRQRIRATLRTALNSAISQQVITFNAAAYVELAAGKRPKALLWSAERIARWKVTGQKPSAVMVWTPTQIGAFLDFIAEQPLYALFHLISFRGLRRGEACGARWEDIDLDTGTLTVAVELVQDVYVVYESEPKSDSGARTIALDKETVRVLREHRKQQLTAAAARKEAGQDWTDSGRVFVKEDGTWLHPQSVSDLFERLVADSGLPPIRLHDLRHSAATLIHASGGDMTVIKETLGHSGIAISADTYTSLLPEVDQAVAEAAAALVPRARKSAPTTPVVGPEG